ncbi:MAG TPA: biotin carboxylase N-terminal domain-containing protein, partial [Chitinophagales bacterium]
MVNINSILIVNRGEIACRVIKTCKKLGIKCIAVFSDADKNSLFVKQADEAYALHGNSPLETYLNQDKILEIARISGADAVHPGYGFLSENAAFAKRCTENNIVWIGPNPKAISAMGSKSEAKKLMIEAGVPTVPGYNGDDQSDEILISEAEKIGYPVLLKASAGGGGKGMRIVYATSEMHKAIESAKSEAQSSFGDTRMIVEKYIENARHIEFQIFGDKHGNAYHLLERECSIQRRYQKVVEESPSPVLSESTRKKMGETAVQIVKTLNYDNAGTVEFVYDEKSDSYYFLEVNTRLQVEHPVTEMITGLDLVELQIQAAEGREIKLNQEAIKANGYAVEVRLYAENPENNFMPETGKILDWQMPNVDGLRIDTGIEAGSVISTFYDPMIAKIIAHGNDRATAHRKLKYALQNIRCLGLKTNQNFLLQLFNNDDVANGNYSTKFLETKFDLKATKIEHSEKIKSALAVTLFEWSQRNNLNDTLS